MALKKGMEYTAVIEKTAFPNKGVCFVDEDKVVVKEALVGQEVRFAIGKKRSGSYEGKLHEVIKRSPLESREPLCPHFGMCGGCSYQRLSYDDQLKLKAEQVKKLITDSIGDTFIFEGISASPLQTGYRNKMEFSFGDVCRDGDLSLGLHKKGSFYDILEINGCVITHDDYNKINSCVLSWGREHGLTYCHKVTHQGYLRHLLVRRAATTGEILISLVTTSQWNFEENETVLLGELKERLLKLDLDGSIVGILHCINDDPADDVRAQSTVVLHGKEFFFEELLGLIFKISTFSFFQTNSFGAEVLYGIARDYVGDTKDKVVFDLYSGTGTIAQMLAPVAKKVVGVEIVSEAVEAARENAALNGLSNCEFICGDVLKVLDEITDMPDIIVLDPPREGIHPKAIGKIINYGVKNLVYISCKPTSLANDLKAFIEGGYEVKKVRCCDMFPQTVHVETVVLLSQLRQKPDDYIHVDVDVAELEGTSAETKATYEKIKKYVAEHNDGMKVSSLYIAQVKRKFGIELGKNFNLPKSEDSRQPKCPKEKEEAIVEALKAFQMI